MGNSCECIRRQGRDEAEDALLASLVGEGTDRAPRGPPPPYQPQAPIYNYALAAMSEERRVQLIRRITIIQSLPCVQYELKSDKEKKKEPRECAICMMDYAPGDPIRLLPCMHYYHLHCIDDWLMRSLTCPSCMERVDRGIVTTLHTSGGVRMHRQSFTLRRRRSRGSTSDAHNSRGSGGPSGTHHTSTPSPSTSSASSTEQLVPLGSQGPPQGGRQNLFLRRVVMASHPPQNSDLGPLPQFITSPPPPHSLPPVTAGAEHSSPIN